MKKILYSLGCKCDPHFTCQTFFREHTAPSLFAGTIQLQKESDEFIPLKLFNGELEKYFFGLENWNEIERLSSKDFNSITDGIYRYVETKTRFQYFNNRQNRTFNLNPEIDKYVFDSVPNHKCYINEKLHIMNTHASDKTPGTNPQYEDYQRKKYDFFQNNKYKMIFLIYLHKNTREDQLINFERYLYENGYDIDNFIIFNRVEKFNGINIKQVSMPDIDYDHSNQCYTQQQHIMRLEINSKLTVSSGR